MAAIWALPAWQGGLVDTVALPVLGVSARWALAVMATLASWDRVRSALLVVLAAEVAAMVPCHMLVADRASTHRRQTTSTSVVEVISMLFDPGEISHASSRLAAF